MMIETEVGNFELLKNYRDAFDIVKFQERYVDVAFDRYTYIVGDIASDKLRLRGLVKTLKEQMVIKKFQTTLMNLVTIIALFSF